MTQGADPTASGPGRACRLQSARQQLQASVADAGDRILTCVADLQSPDQAASALAQARTHWGRVDVLVNSASGAQRAPPADLDAQAWRDAMNAKFFTGVVLTMDGGCTPMVV